MAEVFNLTRVAVTRKLAGLESPDIETVLSAMYEYDGTLSQRVEAATDFMTHRRSGLTFDQCIAHLHKQLLKFETRTPVAFGRRRNDGVANGTA